MTVFEKAYAKVNLILKVAGGSGGYHQLDGVVATVDLFDDVIVRSRNDKKVKIDLKGVPLSFLAEYEPERDNAYKAAKLYSEQTGSFGADITLRKRIPFSGGMGGSSTDAAAVLRAMERIYKKGADLKTLADALGSDTSYLLKGGVCRMRGRGEITQEIELKNDFYITAVFCSEGVDTGECFKKFDELNVGERLDNGRIERFIASLQSDEPAFELCYNDLYAAAKTLCGGVLVAYEAIASLSPTVTFMTGSGSTVCGVFETKELCDWATDKLRSDGFACATLKTVKNPNGKLFD